MRFHPGESDPAWREFARDAVRQRDAVEALLVGVGAACVGTPACVGTAELRRALELDDRAAVATVNEEIRAGLARSMDSRQ